MENLIETHKSLDGKLTLNVYQDTCIESPREWDNICKFIFTDGLNESDFKFEGNYESREDFEEKGQEELERFYGKDVMYVSSVNKYSHSGVSYSLIRSGNYNCQWDSGTVGFIVLLKSEIRKAFDVKRVYHKDVEKYVTIMENELETYNQYVSGDVYYFDVVDKDETSIDSCGGFYGSDIKTNGILENVSGFDNLKDVA